MRGALIARVASLALLAPAPACPLPPRIAPPALPTCRAPLGLGTRAMSAAPAPTPPVAKKVPYKHVYHGREFADDYHWMRDDDRKAKRPEIMEHLEAEKAYATEMLKPYAPLKEEIYKELVGRVQEDDVDVPVKKGDYYYYKKTVKGLQYPIHVRKRGGMGDEVPEEVLLDQNKMTEEYIVLGAYEPSPDHNLLAYSLDTVGNEFFRIVVKDLRTGELLPDSVENTDGTIEWFEDSKSLLYLTLDDIQRPDRLFRHVLGEPQSADALLLHEPDEKFRLGIGKTNSGRYIMVSAESSQTSEVRILDAHSPDAPMRLFHPRTPELSYSVDHQGSRFLVLTNDARERINYRLVSVPVDDPGRWSDWTAEVVPYDPYTYLSGIECFRDFVAVYAKSDAVKRLRILKANADGDVDGKGESYVLEFPEDVYALYGSPTSDQDYDSSSVRFSFSSPVTPPTLYSHSVATRSNTLLKRQPVPNYDPSLYACERIYAPVDPSTLPSPDEKVFRLTKVPERVPITVVYRKDNFRRDGTNPCLLYGYGSYGISMESGFKSSIFSYLDRGFIHATAHIRGGGDCGLAWYENGKFRYKRNTFVDFINAGKVLVDSRYTSRDVLAIEGRSAGGLLIGAVLNMAPDMCRLAFAGVPFVDVINTMMDPTIPLTVNEWEEWGNPAEDEFFDYMLSYSPYDNVKEGVAMPNILVKTGLWDPRVQYWEPSKWVARLRELADKSNKHDLVYLINTGAGHFGKTGRYAYLEEIAEELAFIIGKMESYRKDGLKQRI